MRGRRLVHGFRRHTTTAINDLDNFRALEPFFRTIEEGLSGLADGDNFFDLLADDVVLEYVITVPGYPRARRRSLSGGRLAPDLATLRSFIPVRLAGPVPAPRCARQR